MSFGVRKTISLVFVSAVLAAIGYFCLFQKEPATSVVKTVRESADPISDPFIDAKDELLELFFPVETGFIPGPIDMETLKKKGCVADGLLSDYGDDRKHSVALINRSNCVYLHRALETWLKPPNFGKAMRVMSQIKKKDAVYGMFIAEAIDKKANYEYQEENRDFKFSKMCRPGTDNVWGEHTCKPSFAKAEYRKYLKTITRRAMDIGIQSFLFGQIYYQDESREDNGDLEEVLKDMRSYAKAKGIDIVIGAQTGDITDEDYLRQFDYIEGGVGIGSDGKIESGPCWSHLESCWALLWNDRYAKKANNVFLHLDWSGLKFDDMSTFARMDGDKRREVAKELYEYFTEKDMGFMLPFMATLNKDNGGCHGPKKRFYTADNKYSCDDEDYFNKLMK